MPAQVLEDLKNEVAETVTVQASAAALISGISAKIQAAVDAALANGATEAELAPLAAVVSELDASNKALADAVAANP